MSLNIDMKIIRPWKCSGSESWEKYIHSNSIGSPSIVSEALYSGELLNQLNFSSQTQNLKIRKPLHAIDWWRLHHCPTINCSDMSNICFKVRSFPVFLMECKLCEWFFPMNTDASTLKTQTFPRLKNVCCCLALHLLKNGPTSWAIDHSPCSRMIVTLEKGLILWRCQSPYHYRWKTCHLRVFPFLLPSLHQMSTLEKTIFRQHSTLSSLMNKCP